MSCKVTEIELDFMSDSFTDFGICMDFMDMIFFFFFSFGFFFSSADTTDKSSCHFSSDLVRWHQVVSFYMCTVKIASFLSLVFYC